MHRVQQLFNAAGKNSLSKSPFISLLKPSFALTTGLLLSACAQQPAIESKPVFEPVPELSTMALSRFQCHADASLTTTRHGDHQLHTAQNVSFANVDRLLIHETRWHWTQAAYSTSRVSDEQSQQLHRIVEQSISSEWRQRFAWIPSDKSGPKTLGLQVWISDFDPSDVELSHSITVSARLSDSVSGQTLLQVCDSTLPLTAQALPQDQQNLEPDSGLSRRVFEALTLWASAIGSHIAAQP